MYSHVHCSSLTDVFLLLFFIIQDMYKLAKLVVGKVRYVGWPYLVEAKVHAIGDGKTKYYQDSGSHKSRAKIVEHVMSEKEMKQWREDETAIHRQ